MKKVKYFQNRNPVIFTVLNSDILTKTQNSESKDLNIYLTLPLAVTVQQCTRHLTSYSPRLCFFFFNFYGRNIYFIVTRGLSAIMCIKPLR